MDWNKAFPETNFNFEDEDVRIEKTVKTLTKSPEEIAKLTIDESLSDIDRAQLLITTGQEVQQICAISQLPRLLEYHNVDAMCRVVPQLMDVLRNTSSAVNETAANSFVAVVQKELVPNHLYISSFLPSILRGIEGRDVAVNKIWMNVLLESIGYLTKEIIKGDVVSIALAKGQLSQTVTSRLASCRIIGKICASKKVDAYWIKQDLLLMTTSLCQDVDFEVRSCMCRQLDPISRGLGLNLAKSCVFHELIELSRDEESSVRIASLDTLVDLLDFFDKNYIKDTVVPLFHKFFDQSFSTQDACFKAVALHIGKICYHLKGYLDDSEKLWFIRYYSKIANVTSPDDNVESLLVPSSAPVSCVSLSPTTDDVESDLRHLCAYNIPAMVMFQGKEKFSRDLLDVLNKLADDGNVQVRQSIAYGIHEVAAVLHCDAMRISSVYIKLMKDKSVSVLQGLIEHLPQAMIEFARAANLSAITKAPGLSEFIPGLLAMEQSCAKSSKWRLHSNLLNQFACLVHCLTSEQIYLKFVPLLFKYICTSCVLPVKHAASQTLCVIIRHNRKQEQRDDLCRRIVDDCAHSNKHKLRLLFVDMCKFVMDLFSKNFFKEHFCEVLLELASDPVANVRLSVSHLLPNVKRSLKLPTDRLLLQQLDHTIRKLYSFEHDTDVCHTVRMTLPELNRIEVAVETLSRKNTFMEEDLIDQKKEQEEKLLLLAEEQDTKEADSSAKGKQSAGSKDKPKNPPAKRFILKPIRTSPALNRKTTNNSLPASPVLSSTTAPLRASSSANTTPTISRRVTSPPTGLANCLTSTPTTTMTCNPLSSNLPSSSTSGGNSPIGVMKKAATIPKIVTTSSGSPGLQKKESSSPVSRGSKTPVPSETKSQPSLDGRSVSSTSSHSTKNSPFELRKPKLKDDKATSRSAPSGSRRKPLSSTACTSAGRKRT